MFCTRKILSVVAVAGLLSTITPAAAPAEKSPAKAAAKLITLGTGAGNPSQTRNNSCTFLQTSHGAYLIDAGGPVTASIIRKKLDFNSIRAVFITHMHEDHFGGLPGFLKNRMVKYGPYTRKSLWKGFWPEVWLPDADGIKAFEMLMDVQFRGQGKEKIIWKLINPGPFYDDGHLKVTAIPNQHFKFEGKYLPSYCFLFEVEGKKLLFTGDLRNDLADLRLMPPKMPTLFCVNSLTMFFQDIMTSFRKSNRANSFSIMLQLATKNFSPILSKS
jgi:hypothetical protein